jgi:hypothetical protein
MAGNLASIDNGARLMSIRGGSHDMSSRGDRSRNLGQLLTDTPICYGGFVINDLWGLCSKFRRAHPLMLLCKLRRDRAFAVAQRGHRDRMGAKLDNQAPAWC